MSFLKRQNYSSPFKLKKSTKIWSTNGMLKSLLNKIQSEVKGNVSQ